MLGHHVDGGYAEYIAVPARNAIPLPEEVSFEAGATLMCASATALHALRKGRIRAGERVAVFGVGGLGLSAIQLAKAMGAVEVYAVDIQPSKLELASSMMPFRSMPPAATRWRRSGGSPAAGAWTWRSK
jgi:D-arabinose 1-dehydrogenase-like Zn-dependent alcohol dehydrogenase